MLLKISIVVIYCIALFRFFVKWKKCNFIMQGNGMLMFQIIVPSAFVLPGTVETLLWRLLLYMSVFGICSFWHMLSAKMTDAVAKLALIAIGTLFLLEGLSVVLSWEDVSWLYPVYVITVFIFFYATCIIKCNEEKILKSMFNLGKLRPALAAGSLPALVGTFTLVVYHFSGKNSYAGWVSVALASLLPLAYVYRYKPACWNYDQMVELKRKAYLLGRTINKDGHCLEDDGGIINGCVVDDARILYNIMRLFEEEKIYRKAEIKIGDVAKRIGTNKTYLSRALNTRVSKNFCQFVNHYRIREICICYLKDPKKEIRVLGEQCGFSSQSNFSIVFKYNTGYTPGDWCRIVKNKLEKNEAVDVDDYLL